MGAFVRDRHLVNNLEAGSVLWSSETEMSNSSYGPWLTGGRRLQQATKEGEAQREGVRGEGGAGGNNLESSFSTLTAKVASTERRAGARPLI